MGICPDQLRTHLNSWTYSHGRYCIHRGILWNCQSQLLRTKSEKLLRPQFDGWTWSSLLRPCPSKMAKYRNRVSVEVKNNSKYRIDRNAALLETYLKLVNIIFVTMFVTSPTGTFDTTKGTFGMARTRYRKYVKAMTSFLGGSKLLYNIWHPKWFLCTAIFFESLGKICLMGHRKYDFLFILLGDV